MSLQGQVEEVSLGAIIQTLSLNRYRGTLRIESDEAGSQFFAISEGEIVLVRQVQRDPVRLGDLLIRAGRLTQGDLERALAEQQAMGKRLGEVLVDLGLVTQEDIDRTIRGKFEEEFLDVFLLDRGRFEFIFGLTPEALFAPEERIERVTLNTSGLMLEAMRRIDEWQGMITALGSLDLIYQNRAQSIGGPITDWDLAGVSLPASARLTIYELIDGRRSLREVLGQALRQGLSTRLETFQFLHALKQQELIKSLDFKALLGEAKKALDSGDVPGAAKYVRGVLAQKGQIDTGLVKRYIAFLVKHQRPRLAFDEARALALQCLSRGETEQAITLFEEALGLELKSVEVVDRLFYALLRANRRARAIEVGLLVRDFVGSEEHGGVVARITTNLLELAPQDPAVVELHGRLLARQERNEEAVEALERARALAPEDHPRRREIVAALRALQPDRADLVTENERLEAEAARREARREQRRALLALGGVFLGVVVVWRVWQDVQARASLDAAQALVAGGLPDFETYYRASRLLQGARSDGLTTVSGAAGQLQDELDASWAARMREIDEERKRDAAERQAREAERASAEAVVQRKLAFETALAEYRRLVANEEWALASARAQAIVAEHGELAREGGAELRVHVVVGATAPGAEVLVQGEVVGRAPCTVPIPLGGEVVVGARARGHRTAERKLAGDGFARVELALEPGPAWSVALDPSPVAHDLGPQAAAVVDGRGLLRLLSLSSGRERWRADLGAALGEAGRGEAPIDGLVLAGRTVVVAAGPALVAVEARTGQVEWTRRLEGDSGRAFLRTARILSQELVVVARGAALVVLDASAGAELARVSLPAQVEHRPAVGGTLAFVPLRGGDVVAVDLTRPDGATAWRAPGLAPVQAPIYSELAKAVLVVEEQRVRVLGAADGKQQATLEPQVGPIRGVVLAQERAYVVGQGGLLAALRVYDGQLLLRPTRAARAVSAGPVLVGEDVVLTDDAGEVVQLTPSARRRPTSITLDRAPTAPLLAQEGRVLGLLGPDVVLFEPVARD